MQRVCIVGKQLRPGRKTRCAWEAAAIIFLPMGINSCTKVSKGKQPSSSLFVAPRTIYPCFSSPPPPGLLRQPRSLHPHPIGSRPLHPRPRDVGRAGHHHEPCVMMSVMMSSADAGWVGPGPCMKRIPTEPLSIRAADPSSRVLGYHQQHRDAHRVAAPASSRGTSAARVRRTNGSPVPTAAS